LIKAVAVLRHRNRQRDETGRLIAEIEDYALVHELVGQMYETSVTRVSDKIRRVIRALGELRNANVTPLSATKAAAHLGVSKQAITQAIKTALKQGWIVNHETKRGYPHDLDVGEPLPQALGLPDPESLREEPGAPQEDEVAETIELQVPDDAQDTAERQAVQSLTGERW
jgi:biotin operon repressor